MKAIILARVSTKEQQEEGYSIPSQVRRLTEYAQKKQLTVYKTFQITESSCLGLNFPGKSVVPIFRLCEILPR